MSLTLHFYVVREQQEEYLPLAVGGLHRGDAVLPGAEEDSPARGGDALRGGRTVAAFGSRGVSGACSYFFIFFP